MSENKSFIPLVVVVGPTAVGKTDLSIRLAERLGAEIVSIDSRLFYRGMDIGTAKPTKEERLRVPHHLIDVANPDEPWSLALFQTTVTEIIEEIHARGKLPILVGGTGQYVRAVVEAWEVPPQSPDDRLRLVLEQWGKDIGARQLYERLSIIDSDAASHIEPNNLRRTVRALEVIFLTGRKFSELRKKGETPYDVLIIGLRRPREEIYHRVDRRIEKMIQDGLLDEVKSLLDRGYSSDLSTFSAIGYREMISVLKGEMDMDQAVTRMKSLTHQFVRRQANWFKESDPGIHWFDISQTNDDEIELLVRDTFV